MQTLRVKPIQLIPAGDVIEIWVFAARAWMYRGPEENTKALSPVEEKCRAREVSQTPTGKKVARS
jgi:hypothetical protein